MIYGKRDERGRIVANVELRVWQTPEGRWVLRTETRYPAGKTLVGPPAVPPCEPKPKESNQ